MVASVTITTSLELLAAQVDCEVLTLPTGSKVFSRGSRADSIYGVRRGILML
jgi:CRP-like cAMP-binding protein